MKEQQRITPHYDHVDKSAESAVHEGKDRHVLIISAVIVAAFVAYGAIAPQSLSAVADVLFEVCTVDFGWLYLLSVFLMVVYAVGVGISKYGNIKLGHDDDEPEFTNFQWFAQLFSGGLGIGLVFWSVAEPMMDYLAPPSAMPETNEAMHEAMQTVFFHWSISPWAVFAVAGLGLGYFAFRKDRPFLVSSAFEPLLGEERVRGPIGKAIDILAVFATIFGVATSLGLGTIQITGGLEYVYGIEQSIVLKCAIIAGITVLFTLAAVSGVGKAMQVVANIKVYLSLAFIVFIFVFGGAVFICNIFVSDVGGFLQNFIHKSLWLENGDFVQSWTVFYWAWWIAWAPFCGQFVARVSRGRTIRSYLFAVMLLPAGFCVVWLAVYGGAAFNLNELTGGAIQAAVGGENGTTIALFAFLKELPGYVVTAPLGIVLIVVCFWGAANSAIFVLSMLTDNGNMEPSKPLRAGWGIAQGSMTLICIIAGGEGILKILQTLSIAAAFPYMFVVLLMAVAMLKALREDPWTRAQAKVQARQEAELAALMEQDGGNAA
ncbi:MAG: BCCT family transporter [Eggerthellaceae bacterium]|nr:BCCT family transporter [Eggerthellaceae bacterium]